MGGGGCESRANQKSWIPPWPQADLACVSVEYLDFFLNCIRTVNFPGPRVMDWAASHLTQGQRTKAHSADESRKEQTKTVAAQDNFKKKLPTRKYSSTTFILTDV